MISKSGTTGTITGRMYINTGNTLNGSETLIASGSTNPVGTRSFVLSRRFIINKSSLQSLDYFLSAQNNDTVSLIPLNTNFNTVTVNWSTNQHIIVTASKGSSSDTSCCEFINVGTI
jgi:hypothetical protein